MEKYRLLMYIKFSRDNFEAYGGEQTLALKKGIQIII